MKRYAINYQPEAVDQFEALFKFLAAAADADVAARYVDTVTEFCQRLETFPNRGTLRNDLRPGLRVMSFRRRVVITFTVGENHVDIVGVFYGGQNWEAAFSD